MPSVPSLFLQGQKHKAAKLSSPPIGKGGAGTHAATAGSPRAGGELSEEHAVLGAEIVDRGDHESRDLVGGQIGFVQDLHAEVDGVGAVVDGEADIVACVDRALRAVVGDALAR